MFKIKDVFKLELQTPGTTKLLGSTKKLIDKTKNGKSVPSLEVVGAVLVQYDLSTKISLRYYIVLHPINLMFIC